MDQAMTSRIDRITLGRMIYVEYSDGDQSTEQFTTDRAGKLIGDALAAGFEVSIDDLRVTLIRRGSADGLGLLESEIKADEG
jgi:hypothetical protein